MRGPLAWYLSSRLHRPVAIIGNLQVHPWSLSPTASVEGLTIGQGRGAQAVQSLALKRLSLQVRLLPLFAGRIELPMLWVDQPRGALVLNEGGQAGSLKVQFRPPQIDRLMITDGRLRVLDPAYRVEFNGLINTNETRAGTGPNITVIDGAMVMGGPAWAGPRPLAQAPRLTARVRLLPMMAGRLEIPFLSADQPRVHLVREFDGRTNWQFGAGGKDKPFHAPAIGRLLISGGRIDYQDARNRISFDGSASTDESVGTVGHGKFVLQGQGRKDGAAFTARVAGGPLINIDPGRPYPISIELQAAATSMSFDGTFARAFDFTAFQGRGRVKGLDLSNLYPLTGVALPSTPPYDLSAQVSRSGGRYQFDALQGRMGDSDLQGVLAVDNRAGRPFISGDLRSRRLNLADLTAVTGGTPKHATGHTLSPAQKTMMARLAAEHRVLPDAHLDVARIRTTDARVSYRAGRVTAGSLPIRGLTLSIVLDHGRLRIDPLRMDLPGGNLAANVSLDATGRTPVETLDARLTNGRLENLVNRSSSQPPLEGGVFARLNLSGRGDSVRAAAASANGAVVAVIPRGELRQAFAELLGIDATKGLFLLLTKDQAETPIRCAVADFRAVNGVLTARRLVLDTGVVLANGRGQIDLRDEALNLRLDGKPKKFRLVRIGAPITLNGYLASPKVGVDVAKAAGQLAISGLLGAVVAPLSAILPFVNPGLAHDADCAALEAEAGH